MKNGSRKKLAFMLGVLGSCLLVILAVCSFVLKKRESRMVREWREAIEAGDNFAADGDYGAAEFCYEEAIALFPTRYEEPYVKLADVYIAMGALESSREVVEQGLRRVRFCSGLYNSMERLELLQADGEGETAASSVPDGGNETSAEEIQGGAPGPDYRSGAGAGQDGTAVIIMGEHSVGFYRNGEAHGNLTVSGKPEEISFNGETLLYTYRQEDGSYALCENDWSKNRESLLYEWEEKLVPVAKVGNILYFLREEREAAVLCSLEEGNVSPLADRVLQAMECEDSIYYLKETENAPELFRMDQRGEEQMLSSCCRYLKVKDGQICFAEARNDENGRDQWGKVSFYRYDSAGGTYELLGVIQEENVRIAESAGNCVVYYVEYIREGKPNRIYYRTDFLLDRAAFLLETEDAVEILEDHGIFYFFNRTEGSVSRISDNAVLELEWQLEPEEELVQIYDRWIYRKDAEGNVCGIVCSNP